MSNVLLGVSTFCLILTLLLSGRRGRERGKKGEEGRGRGKKGEVCLKQRNDIH